MFNLDHDLFSLHAALQRETRLTHDAWHLQAERALAVSHRVLARFQKVRLATSHDRTARVSADSASSVLEREAAVDHERIRLLVIDPALMRRDGIARFADASG
jgi:hypothetical protein